MELVGTADRRVDVKLEVGNLTETVTVTAGAQLIETERATVSDVKSLQVFTVMPVVSNYRSIWRMLALSPGVSGAGSYYAGNGTGRNTTYSIDGIPIKDGWTGSSFGPALTYLDSYREYRVDITSVNATGGTSSNVTVISESGARTSFTARPGCTITPSVSRRGRSSLPRARPALSFFRSAQRQDRRARVARPAL